MKYREALLYRPDHPSPRITQHGGRAVCNS